MTAICTVTIGTGVCGQPAVHTWESRMSGKEFGECVEHHVAVTPVAPETVVGRKVEIHWHTWAKRGEVVAERGSRVVVRFVPRAGAEPIEREFKVEEVKFIK